MTKELTIKNIIQETSDAITIEFEETFEHLPYTAGQYLTVFVSIENEIFKREYSFSSSPQVNEHISITVKRIKNGKVSNYLYSETFIGKKISITASEGRFSANLNLSNKRTIVLIAGGSGITPLYSIAKSVLSVERQSKVYLLYANGSENDIIFRNELEKLQIQFEGRFNHLNILSRPTDKWYGIEDRLDRDNLIYYLEQLPVIFPKEAAYYICAPNGLITEIEAGLRSLKIPSSKIHKESFGTAGIAEPTGSFNNQTVIIKYKDETYQFVVPSGKSILKAAQDEEIQLPYSCEKGNCGACIGTCISGKIDMGNNTTLNESEIKANKILTCISKPLTNDVIIEID